MSGSERLREWMAPLIVGLVPIVLTLERMRNAFVLDDIFVLERGPLVHDPSQIGEVWRGRAMVASSLERAMGSVGMDTYRPVPLSSFFFDAWVSGRDPVAYHITSAALHGITAVLVYAGLRQSLRRKEHRGLAALAGLSFGLNPWLAEAHVFINGRSDVLAGLGVAWALWAAGRGGRGRGRGMELAFACALAMFSKETALFAMPFVMLRASRGSDARKQSVAIISVVAVYLAARAAALGGLRTHDEGQLLEAAAHLPLLLVDGVWHLAIPNDYSLRSVFHDYRTLGAGVRGAALIMSLMLGGLGVVAARRRPHIALGVGLMLLTLAPAAMVTVGFWPGFGRFLYVPAIGGAWVAGHGIAALRRQPAQRMALAVLAVQVALSGTFLVFATRTFADEGVLYEAAIRREDGAPWARGLLGLSLGRDGRCREAVPELEAAVLGESDEPRFALRLGHCLLQMRRPADVRRLAAAGLRRFEGTRQEAGFHWLAAAATPRDELDRALFHLERCLALDPERSDCARGLDLARRAAPGPR